MKTLKNPAKRTFGTLSCRVWPGGLLAAALLLAIVHAAGAADGYSRASIYLKSTSGCPAGWIESSAPGGCSPEFFTLKFADLRSTSGCPSGWVKSSAPGGCSPEFFTLRLNGIRDSIRTCPDGWVRSSAPGGCSPEYLTLKLLEIEAAGDCPSGWVRSSAPGGCSPDNFTLEPDFDGADHAYFHCPFGDFCAPMVEALIALGGHCDDDGRDTTCVLPPLVE